MRRKILSVPSGLGSLDNISIPEGMRIIGEGSQTISLLLHDSNQSIDIRMSPQNKTVSVTWRRRGATHRSDGPAYYVYEPISHEKIKSFFTYLVGFYDLEEANFDKELGPPSCTEWYYDGYRLKGFEQVDILWAG